MKPNKKFRFFSRGFSLTSVQDHITVPRNNSLKIISKSRASTNPSNEKEKLAKLTPPRKGPARNKNVKK